MEGQIGFIAENDAKGGRKNGIERSGIMKGT
jgi:hypothetical protein